MSPSHLLYYFPGKERILEDYFADVAEWFLQRIEEIARQPREDQVELWARLWFGHSEAAHEDIGFMLECFGAAVHDGAMRQTKARFDTACKALALKLPTVTVRARLGSGVMPVLHRR